MNYERASEVWARAYRIKIGSVLSIDRPFKSYESGFFFTGNVMYDAHLHRVGSVRRFSHGGVALSSTIGWVFPFFILRKIKVKINTA